jgi:lipoprotein-anchoring transpeptidase ErfK/SrfK
MLGQGKALRYGIGVGRERFTWSGAERVSRVAEWPDWNAVSAVRDNARQVEFKAESAGFEE